MKPIHWIGSSLDDLRAFPQDARRRAGQELLRLQEGEQPIDWKPMPSVGSGVQELRVRVGTTHRVFYVAKYAEAIYVLHAFEKKSQKTSKSDLELGRRRLAEVLRRRSGK